MLSSVGRKKETKNFATSKSQFQLDGNEISMLRSMMTHGGISHLQLLCSYSSGGHDVKILWSTSRMAGISSGFSVNVANILCTKCFNVENIFLMMTHHH